MNWTAFMFVLLVVAGMAVWIIGMILPASFLDARVSDGAATLYCFGYVVLTAAISVGLLAH
jgi:hypothetical protein